MMPKSTPLSVPQKSKLKTSSNAQCLQLDLSTSRFVCSQEFSFLFQSRAGARTTTKPVLFRLLAHSEKA